MAEDIAQRIHSINIGGYNTWRDFHLIPTERPSVNTPAKKESAIDIPATDGELDESDLLTGYPTYQMRTGSWEFYVANNMELSDEYYGDWCSRYTAIADAIHGLRNTQVILVDDPSWYYEGIVQVKDWKTQKDWSRLTMDYKLRPYKRARYDSMSGESRWWDRINFETDYLYEYDGHTLDSDPDGVKEYSYSIIPHGTENNPNGENLRGIWDIHLNSPNSFQTFEFTDGYFGREPASPIVHISNSDNNGVIIRLINPELSIDRTTAPIKNTSSSGTRLGGFIFSTIRSSNTVTLKLKGIGTVSFEFRTGRL